VSILARRRRNFQYNEESGLRPAGPVLASAPYGCFAGAWGVAVCWVREKYMRTCYLAGVVAITALLSVGSLERADAISVNVVLNDASTVPNTSNSPQLPLPFPISNATIDTPVGNLFVNGTLVARSPWETTPFQNVLQYTSVRDGTAVYNISGNGLRILWGSPDSYNTLTFYTGLNGTGTAASITGDALVPPGTTGLGHHLVWILTGETFQSVSISSGRPAFEFSNMVATTPLPPALPLLATGLGVMGWLARRRRRRTSVLLHFEEKGASKGGLGETRPHGCAAFNGTIGPPMN